MNRRALRRAGLLLMLFMAPSADAAELSVAAASNFSYALGEIVTAFETVHPEVSVSVSYGSSGNFYAQLQAGAPYDIFLSADMVYPRRLAGAGFALDGEVFTYAIGHIVLWVPGTSPLDVASLGMRALLGPSVRKIAIANPGLAPYGAAAQAAMKSFGVYARARPKLILGENIAQTAQFVQSGAADIGILAKSLALGPRMRKAGRFWEIPQRAHAAIEQGGIILAGTRHPGEARALRDFIHSRRGAVILERYGYARPGSPAGEGGETWTGKPSG